MFTITVRKYHVMILVIFAVVFAITQVDFTFAERLVLGKDRPAKELVQGKEREPKYRDAILKMEKHLHVKDGFIVLKARRGAEIGVDQALFDELTVALNATNEKIKAGEVKVEDVILHTNFEEDAPQHDHPPHYSQDE